MSCVLRVTSSRLTEHLPVISIRPYRVEEGTAHFDVSKCDFNDFAGQVRDAIEYLRTNRLALTALMNAIGAEGVLDFAVEVGSGFQFRAFPPALVREAAALGLGLEMSLYSKARPAVDT